MKVWEEMNGHAIKTYTDTKLHASLVLPALLRYN